MANIPRDYNDTGISVDEKMLHQIIEQDDGEGWKELPDDAVFAMAELPEKPKRLAQLKKSIKRRISKIFRRKRAYAYRIS
jgi:hypothetical protein